MNLKNVQFVGLLYIRNTHTHTYIHIGRGRDLQNIVKLVGGRHIKTQLSLYLIYQADDMFRPLRAIHKSQKCIMRKTYTVLRPLVVVHIVNFQRDLVVMRFIRIELIIRSTSIVDRVMVRYIYTLYVISHKQSALSLNLWPWSWTFTVQHTIYVKCEYFMNQEG